MDSCHFVRKYFALISLLLWILILLSKYYIIYQISYGTNLQSKQSKPSSLAWEKNLISYKNSKLSIKKSRPKWIWEKVTIIYRNVFFNKKFPKKSRQFITLRTTIFTSFQLKYLLWKREITCKLKSAGPKFWMTEAINRFNHHQVKNFKYQAVYQLNPK